MMKFDDDGVFYCTSKVKYEYVVRERWRNNNNLHEYNPIPL